MNKLTDFVASLARPLAEAEDCDIWDVEFVREGGERILRVLIDREDGVSVDRCVAVSRALSALLDEHDPIEEAYILEVSSAGAERALKRQSDFDRFLGHLVEVRLYRAEHGAKTHEGILLSRDEASLSVETDGSTRTFETGNISRVRLRLDMSRY